MNQKPITSAAVRINRAFQERLQRILAALDPDVPSYAVTPPDHSIDDGGGYGDIQRDDRPDCVKADDAAIRRKER